ncbi:phospholipase A2-like [Anneissia japonica]|uniref:phospholipase A2-like n=1 Tax=Anneissia japonica TaxID=1529436 RepID=UPI001425A02F|nr:phospholipase A2-like [Anneissia japonica]
MRWLIGVFSITFLLFVCNGAEIGRQKRAVWQFSDMISCTTRVSYLDVMYYYNGYGCFCGQGGSGTPVDALDRCCEAHDNCYQRLRNENTCDVTLLEMYALIYKYSLTRCGGNRPSITCSK